MKDRERGRLRKRILGALPEPTLHVLAGDVGVEASGQMLRGSIETALLEKWERNAQVGTRENAPYAAELIRLKIMDYLQRHL